MKIDENIINEIGRYDDTNDVQILFNAHKWLKDHFTYISETKQYGNELVNELFDIWRPIIKRFEDYGIKLVGDCDDFGLQIISILYQCGYPTEKLWLTCCHAYTGEGHFVPLVETSIGVMQCDNMLTQPIPAYYAFNGVGYYVSEYSNDIMQVSEPGNWYVFDPDNQIPKPSELSNINIVKWKRFK